eukprot:g1640.t1
MIDTFVCIGSGRFIRSLLVPFIREASPKSECHIFQTRGTSFLEYCKDKTINDDNDDGNKVFYEVDTLETTGKVVTKRISFASPPESLGQTSGREKLMSLARDHTITRRVSVIGIGVTEAGLHADSPVLRELTRFLYLCYEMVKKSKDATVSEWNISLINTDNGTIGLPYNGDLLSKLITNNAFLNECGENTKHFQQFCESNITFHNTVVDRMVSHRPENKNIPQAEPIPSKGIIVEDLKSCLPTYFKSSASSSKSNTAVAVAQRRYGIIVRNKPGALDKDRALKLRVMNAIHTAMVYHQVMTGVKMTNDINPTLEKYLTNLFTHDIQKAFRLSFSDSTCDSTNNSTSIKNSDDSVNNTIDAETLALYNEWLQRLRHPYFGMQSVFVTQNAFTKLHIRLAPTYTCLLENDILPSKFMGFAIAALLRYITPKREEGKQQEEEEGESNLNSKHISKKQRVGENSTTQVDYHGDNWRTVEERLEARERDLRLEFSKVFNKKRSDFPNEESYNNYLEWVENLLLRYLNQTSNKESSHQTKLSIRNEIETYRKKHKLQIAHNASMESEQRKKITAALQERHTTYHKRQLQYISEDDQLIVNLLNQTHKATLGEMEGSQVQNSSSNTQTKKKSAGADQYSDDIIDLTLDHENDETRVATTHRHKRQKRVAEGLTSLGAMTSRQTTVDKKSTKNGTSHSTDEEGIHSIKTNMGDKINSKDHQKETEGDTNKTRGNARNYFLKTLSRLRKRKVHSEIERASGFSLNVVMERAQEELDLLSLLNRSNI